jgi:hypothetical protein
MLELRTYRVASWCALHQLRQIVSVGQLGRIGIRQAYHAIYSAPALLLPAEHLADQATNARPIHRSRCVAFGDDQRDACHRQAVHSKVQPEISTSPTTALAQRKLHGCRAEPLPPTKSLVWLQTDRRARPLARRARMTARPPRERIRTRKPCVRLRRTTEGW